MAAPLLDLVDPGALLSRQPAAQVRVEVGEDGRVGAERVDQQKAKEAVLVQVTEVKCEMPAPRVPDRPCTFDAERVEDGQRVGRMRLDRVGRAAIRRGCSALGVPDRGEQPIECLGACTHVVGDRGAAVEQERRRAAAAAMPVQRAAVDGCLEGLLVHEATLLPPRSPRQ